MVYRRLALICLDHEFLLTCEARPYKTVKRMNASFIGRYNALVQPEDTLYFLGDFTMRGPENKRYIQRWVRKMNGHKHLILGNHDYLKPFDYIEIGFESVHTSFKVKIGGWDFYLVHDPAATRVKPGACWLCAHVHGLFKKRGNVLNVGVDVWDYRPVSEAQVLEEFMRSC